uniref:Uncharacterized protein n=1 Tax=Glossina austeni TaxID=7395 RepID=A0A1A9UGM1_GLOAU
MNAYIILIVYTLQMQALLFTAACVAAFRFSLVYMHIDKFTQTTEKEHSFTQGNLYLLLGEAVCPQNESWLPRFKLCSKQRTEARGIIKETYDSLKRNNTSYREHMRLRFIKKLNKAPAHAHLLQYYTELMISTRKQKEMKKVKPQKSSRKFYQITLVKACQLQCIKIEHASCSSHKIKACQLQIMASNCSVA